MADSKNEECAFPQCPDAWGGLTKREEFAKAAMQGLLAHQGAYSNEANYGPGVEPPSRVAASALAHADALLAALAEEPKND